jgi:hypothetical protein
MASHKPAEEENTSIAGPVDPSIAQLVRAKVQPPLNEVHETHDPPPSHDSPAPILRQSLRENEVEAEAQQHAGVVRQNRPRPQLTFRIVMKFIVLLASFIMLFFSWFPLLYRGVDPLAFSFLSFFLVVFCFRTLSQYVKLTFRLYYSYL